MITNALAAGKRLLVLYRTAGPVGACNVMIAGLDDRYLRRFDRQYRIATSGFIELEQTSFDRSRLRQATNYGPVNGWAFRRLLQDLALPTQFHFVDLGSGLGRACIIAAEYGFARVTGVELAPEFCVAARRNVSSCRPPAGKLSPVEILQMDVLDYCDNSDGDVFFMFRPFSEDFLNNVATKLVERARLLKKSIVVIFTERVATGKSFARVLAEHTAFHQIRHTESWAQEFWVFRCGADEITRGERHPDRRSPAV
jgi:SAM-dependent methyltransferase